jgi:ABC-type sugar transport system permease subunit/ABC-type glycerol-3-phosphate transport system substrate-binding protein
MMLRLTEKMKNKFLPAFCLFFFFAVSSNSFAGSVTRTAEGKTRIQVVAWSTPNPALTDTNSRAEYAVHQEFLRRFPEIFEKRYRAKYESNPGKYGDFSWRKEDIEVEFKRFAGITVEGMTMDSGPLMAIAGGVSPDILYVNFRQSDTYIQEGFLYPLDKPEDNYFTSLSQEEREFIVHEKIMPVIKRHKIGESQEYVWSLPRGGLSGRVMLYRKDLLTKNGIPFPDNDWTWEDFLGYCKRLTDPVRGTYGVLLGKGQQESWHWVSFLWSAGGEVMEYNERSDSWRAVFNSKGAVTALDYYLRLTTERWIDRNNVTRYGYATKEPDGGQKWELGQVGFMPTYLRERVFATINPDLVGMAPVPLGYPDENGVRHRGSEINAGMNGIYAGCDNPVVRDAAWEYIRFLPSVEATEIYTKIMVEGGLGNFINPKHLRRFGYEDLIRLAPAGWEEAYDICIEYGKPEPYGRNCQLVYVEMTRPMHLTENMALERDNPSLPLHSAELYEKAEKYKDTTPEQLRAKGADEAELRECAEMREALAKREALLQRVLNEAVTETNEKMLGILSPRQQLARRVGAFCTLVAIAVTFTLVFRKIFKAFVPPKVVGQEQVTWGFRKYKWAYIILLPALLSILVWKYVPLVMGSVMAFQDYRIMGGSQWVWLDNFGNVLWDKEWWETVYNSLKFCFLTISLTFLPPVILAVFLQEIPYGRIFFRTVFYLPAVITGLVVIYLWRSFYEPSEFGVLNAVLMRIPAIGIIGIGLLLFFILYFFAQRLFLHGNRLQGGLCLAAGLLLFYYIFSFALPVINDPLVEGPWYARLLNTMRDPYRWLLDRKTAMLCCVLPNVWAGMGPGCLIYLAALKGVADDFYEAADIDGATFVDKILFVVIPILKPLLIIQFIGIFIRSWENTAMIMAMTGGSSGTNVASLLIFYKAYVYLKFGTATAMAWILGFMLIGFTVHQLQILSKLEFRTTGNKE